ncbi:hypothetical protein C4D60_Mb05t07980 [Musa balbisiana]|uniref:Uncharacterized protein n=1 Tax=Musa balbisiana TaxID=52838 RepID=A0A4S8JUJ6_MUSBA|nr:hypothetical protein C4D60_Mb05t07980 [Musa balbisiana]
MRALWSARVYSSGGGGGRWRCGTVLTMSMMRPMRRPTPSTEPRVQRKSLRLTTTHPRSTYRFFFLPDGSPGAARSQLCCVSSSCRDSAARSYSCRFRLRSSSVKKRWEGVFTLLRLQL